MDQSLLEAIAKNERHTFMNLVRENEEILQQRTVNTLHTPLHLASRFGHIDLVTEIVKLCPDMVAAENSKLETPFHEACRQGNVKVLLLLLDANPWAACKLNSDSQSAFYMACSHGHLNVIKLLLSKPWLQGLEEDNFVHNSLHVAVSRGYTGIVRKILEVCPNFAQKIDRNGYSPLHCSCHRGHVEITRMILKADAELALEFNNDGHTPLHLAAMNGNTAILKEFMSMAPTSFECHTKNGETIFHLIVRYNHYDAFIYLVHAFNDTNIFHCPDQYGNTIFHIAVSGGHHQIVEYLINKTTIDFSFQNHKGLTALDILDQASGNVQIKLIQHQVEKICEIQDNNTSEPECSSKQTNNSLTSTLTSLGKQKRLSERRQGELAELYRSRQSKQDEIYNEAVQNARNTITLVAILIATVTFAAGISPPGGIYQDGPLKGKSMVCKTTAFKVFTLSNNIALFTSLCIVVVLVSIIPFQRKPQMMILKVAHKVMWVAVSFMATAYVAATWVIIPHDKGTEWMFVVLLSIGGGTTGTCFLGLTVMMIEHWLRKQKWRKLRKKSGDRLASIRMQTLHSFNSDVESSSHQGYHSY